MAHAHHAAAAAPGAAPTYQPTMCTVTAVSDLTKVEKLFRIELPAKKELGHQPGQFVQVSIFGIGEAPISICSSPTRKGYFELGVRRTGTLTEAMHAQLKPGSKVGIRGPFGTFMPTDKLKGKDLILIAGGCGLAPMRSLIQYCEDQRDDFKEVNILYGARSPEDRLYKEELTAWEKGVGGLRCQVTVDNAPDASCWDGRVGLITTLIPPLKVDANTYAVIVGPPIMYKFVIQELKKKGMNEDHIVVSLERYMKCGVGKCGHCTIEHLYCCMDGPVFWLNEVSQLKGAL